MPVAVAANKKKDEITVTYLLTVMVTVIADFGRVLFVPLKY